MDEFEQMNETETKADVTAMEPLRSFGKNKKLWLITLISLLVLGIIGGTLWVVLGKNHIEYIAEEVGGDTSGDESATSEEYEDKIVQLNTDDELVQRLWGQFNSPMFTDGLESGIGIMSSFPPLDKFYSEEGALSLNGLVDVYKFVIVIPSIRGEGEFCRGDYDFLRWVERDGTEHPSTEIQACYYGDAIRAKVKEIFGTDISLERFDGQTFISDGDLWQYSAQNDEIANRASGATKPLIRRVLLKAERDEERVYIYERAGYAGCMHQYACFAAKIDGTELASSENVTPENMDSFTEQFDKFKWTFVWNGENYIFESLEKI